MREPSFRRLFAVWLHAFAAGSEKEYVNELV